MFLSTKSKHRSKNLLSEQRSRVDYIPFGILWGNDFPLYNQKADRKQKLSKHDHPNWLHITFDLTTQIGKTAWAGLRSMSLKSVSLDGKCVLGTLELPPQSSLEPQILFLIEITNLYTNCMGNVSWVPLRRQPSLLLSGAGQNGCFSQSWAAARGQ